MAELQLEAYQDFIGLNPERLKTLSPEMIQLGITLLQPVVNGEVKGLRPAVSRVSRVTYDRLQDLMPPQE